MTTLYLVRHGQTTDNVAQIMQGQRQGQLTPEGERQIQTLAEQLAGIHFDAFVSSDLRRAIDSCLIIARVRNMDVVTTPLLRERDWGDFTGRFIPELKGLDFPENVEKMDFMVQRAIDFLQWVADKYPGQTVLAMGHGIINKVIQAVYHHKPTYDIPRMQNAEYRVLTL
jgi:probable phosphoglycerate mutase